MPNSEVAGYERIGELWCLSHRKTYMTCAQLPTCKPTELYVVAEAGAGQASPTTADPELTACVCGHSHLLRRDGDVYAACSVCECDHFRAVHNDLLTEAMARPNWPEGDSRR